MCTAWLDSANGVAHHLAQNLDFAVVAAADLPTLRAYARARGWDKLRLLSASKSTFKYDLGSENPEGHKIQRCQFSLATPTRQCAISIPRIPEWPPTSRSVASTCLLPSGTLWTSHHKAAATGMPASPMGPKSTLLARKFIPDGIVIAGRSGKIPGKRDYRDLAGRSAPNTSRSA